MVEFEQFPYPRGDDASADLAASGVARRLSPRKVRDALPRQGMQALIAMSSSMKLVAGSPSP
jgi:hypothetical protein